MESRSPGPSDARGSAAASMPHCGQASRAMRGHCHPSPRARRRSSSVGSGVCTQAASRMSERVAVVTGGASGMGRSICEQLAARGDRVAVLDVDADGAGAVAGEIGDRAMACTCDVADRSSVDAAMGAVRTEFGPIEILVTSAGITWFAPFVDVTLESWTRVLDVNL